jgi:phosphoglycerol transferase MdoB-like AlkP superfamily enzyme
MHIDSLDTHLPTLGRSTAPVSMAARRFERVLALLAPEIRFTVLLLGIAMAVRLGLLVWFSARVDELSDVRSVLFGGLRMDASLISYVLAPSVILGLVVGGSGRLGRVAAAVRRVYLGCLLVLFVFMEAVTPAYIAEYDGRPDRLFLEYLVHPNEVLSMLLTGFRGELAVVGVATAVGAFVIVRLLRTRPADSSGAGDAVGPVTRLAALIVLAPVLFLGARSTLQHRPANPSTVAFSEDHLLNDLCLSSLYSVAYSALQMRSEQDAARVYGSLESDEAVVAEVRRAMSTVAPRDFVSDGLPTLHRHVATAKPGRPLNLVIILEESLGAQYVEALGGRPVTSFLGTLADEGWWFERMYATGTRSVRGLEAVTAGFLPTPARSVVKLGMSQRSFFTIAELLASQGYHTRFVYGGESHFDNMKRFFTGNGFAEIVDRDDFEAPRFVGSWGVSDGDMFDKLDELLSRGGDRPSFTLAFSVSNHSPWDYPTGAEEPGGFEPDGDPRTVDNAVRYADHALGKFFEKARASSYWDHTIFVVVADHDARVKGASMVPIRHFHIPAVIVGPGVPRRRDPRITSQIDLPPTLLSLLGVSGEHPMVGHDLTKLPLDTPGRAVMQYGANQAWLEGDRAVVLQPSLPPSHYTFDGADLLPAPPDTALQRRALAHALLPSRLYRERLYRTRTPRRLGAEDTPRVVVGTTEGLLPAPALSSGAGAKPPVGGATSGGAH